MSISTNSIIHYTKSLQNLKGILSEGFRIKYCLESTSNTTKAILQGAFPMVCFCDIPLSKVKNHLDSYGCYGIGLTKEWAFTNKLNPVLYLEKNSTLLDKIARQVKRTKNENGEFEQEWLSNFIHICAFTKNYEGELNHKRVKGKIYRFYDEREWRYVPTREVLGELVPDVITSDSYLKQKTKCNEFLSKVKLHFKFDDISYIIVKKEDDIPIITRHLRKVYENNCTSSQLEVLLTKIISVNQINHDF